MKEFKQLGAYGLIVKDDKILLIRKFGGPYDGKLDLPGGTIEFGEKPAQTLKRELEEETGYRANKIEKTCEYFMSPGISDGKSIIGVEFAKRKRGIL